MDGIRAAATSGPLAEGLLRSWTSLFPPGDAPEVAAAGARLLAGYAQPHRRYHDLRHLAEVLARVDDLAPAAGDADLVRLAAWFHDVVYDPTRVDNEEASANLAREVLAGLDVPAGRCADVVRIVRLTATHDPAPGDDDGAVLCDADLAVLGSEPARYAEYRDDVRREYAHLPDAQFARGRAEVLHRLALRNPLFRTPAARSRWEARARANMSFELQQLSRALPDPPPPELSNQATQLTPPTP